ncbi:hypothetical protein [Deinococcus peraridilitoris]|nr:hypothetical protein [Deinococcus peraridilitoris]
MTALIVNPKARVQPGISKRQLLRRTDDVLAAAYSVRACLGYRDIYSD